MLKKSPLNEVSGFYNILRIYKENKHKIWKDWLIHKETFKKPGKQGIVGILNIKDEELQVIYKISQYINYLVQHEFTIMKGLNEISGYCPHFCKSIGIISCNIDPRYRKNEENPFITHTKYPIEKEVLLMENIAQSCKFYNYIRSKKVDEKNLFSIIKQVLMGISIAQKKKRFSHYDLHSFNIMMKTCDHDVVFLYVIDEETQFAVPTLGHFPVIIDFGFAYINTMEDGPLWASMGHTNVGFISDRFDWVADPKLFLVTVSAEIKNKRKSKTAKKFRRIVKNVFNPLKIDWESGWDDVDKRGAMDYISKELELHRNSDSKVFDKYEHYSLDLIQTLIILPLEERNFKDIHVSYKAFVKEFVKIEKVIGDSYYNLYILKGIVDLAREVRPDYLRDSKRKSAISHFRRGLHDRINYVAAWCCPKGIHYELMLCSLLEFTRNMEGFLHFIVSKIMKEKEKTYKKLPLQSVDQIYGAIEVNIPDEYVYTEKTKVFIFDSVKETTSVVKLPQNHLEEINDIHPLGRGTYIYNLINKDKRK